MTTYRTIDGREVEVPPLNPKDPNFFFKYMLTMICVGEVYIKERDLVERFEDIDLAVPIDNDEAKEILDAEGIDPDAALERLRDKISR
jgi:hypothetical protein